MKTNSFILNVTSSEGVFASNLRYPFHVHTNMTKASLDMLTQTLHFTWGKKGIYVFSVDPGYVSGVPSEDINKYPLEPEDGAARVLYPMMILLDKKEPIKNKESIRATYIFKDFKPSKNST